MSEKDGKRVLSPAEKAEADSLTNKQWLYIIGRSAERGNGEKKGRPDVILTVAERILSDIAAIATVIALGVAVFQISVGNWQFDRSGPRFSWFDTGLVSYTTEATLPDGLSGTGDGDAMVLCTPEFDEDGNLMDRDAVSVGGGTVALQPGDSRLVFAVSVHGPIPVTGGLEVATASGRTYHAERVRYVSRLSVDHYARLPGWFDAQDACVRRLGRLG